MKYAAAIRYGGQLVEAAEVGYEDYKALGLLCPNCKEPVFLQGASRRLTRDKVVKVPPHFKHFAAKDPALIKQCEARVAKYDQVEVQRRATIARNQRLKLLQRWFWTILQKYSDVYCGNLDQWILAYIPNHEQDEFCARSYPLFGTNIQHIKEVAAWGSTELVQNNPYYLELVTNMNTCNVDPQVITKETILVRNASKLDIQIQKLIVSEILDYLTAKTSRYLTEKLLFVACCYFYFEVMFRGNTSLALKRKAGAEEIVRWCCYWLITRINLIPWLDEFVKLKQ